MSNSVNITASGGAVSVGTVVQGNNNQAQVTISGTLIQQALDAARERIAVAAREAALPVEAVRGATERLEALGREAQTSAPSEEKGSAIMKTIRQNFSWAYPAFKDLLAVVWPKLLALMV